MGRLTHETTRELSHDECLHLLAAVPWGRIAVVVGDRPQIFPVNHAVHEDAIYFRTGSGTKLDWASGAVVAFQVDGVGEASGAAWSVQVTGLATEVTGARAVTRLLPHLARPMESGAKPHVVRIDVEELSGVTFPAQWLHA